MTHPRILLGSVAVLAAVALTACTPVVQEPRTTVLPAEPTQQQTPAPAPATPAGTIDCAGQPVQLNQGRDIVVVGECPIIEINGADIEVDIEDAAVGTVSISGDRIDVDAGDLDELTIAGQDNDVDAGAVVTVQVNGDRNDLDSGDIGALTIQGNDNEVDAVGIGSAAVSGSRNQVEGARP